MMHMRHSVEQNLIWLKAKASKAAKVYEKLLALGYRLLSVIRKNEGCANKDLEKFSRDVQSLCDKWDRTDG